MPIILDGTLGITTPALTVTGATINTGGISTAGNLTFTSTGNRITGDFSNATTANRVIFQTSTTNGSTGLNAIPNGAGTTSAFAFLNSSNTANTSYTDFGITASESYVISGKVGSGTYLPLTMSTGGSERLRIDTSGNVGIGTSSPTTKLQVQAADVKFNATSGSFAHYIETASTSGGNTASMRLKANTYNYGLYVADNVNSLVFYDYGQSLERMRIDSSGNVGIGTSSPVVKLQVTTSGGAALPPTSGTTPSTGELIRLRTSSDSAGGIGTIGLATNQMWLQATDATGLGTGYQLLLNPNGGNVGIGTSSPAMGVHIVRNWTSGKSTVGAQTITSFASGGTAGFGNYDSDGSRAGYFYSDVSNTYLYSEKNTPMLFGTNNTERMRIDSSGNVAIGLTSAGARLQAQGAGDTGATFCVSFLNSGGFPLFDIRNDGLISTGSRGGSPYNNTTASAANMFVDSSGNLYRSTSSTKYKTDVQNATHGLADVLKLRSVTYKGKNDKDKIFGGLIAEEIHEAGLTEFVQYADDGTPDALAYGNMVSLCIKAIQELNAEVQALKQQLGK